MLGPADSLGVSLEPAAPHLRAAWTEKRLITQRDDPRGGRVSQRFELAPEGKTLTLVVRRAGREGMPPLELRRVYRRYEGD